MERPFQTFGHPSRATRLGVTIVVLASLVIAPLGCAGKAPTSAGNDADGSGLPPTAVEPTTAPDPSAEPTPAAPAPRPVVTVYFPLGETLAAARRTLPATKGVASAALVQLLAGPSVRERAAGMTSAVPAGTRVRGVAVRGKTATVDLSGRYGSGGGTLSMRLRLAQIVYTLTQFPTIESVRFELDGEPVEALGGEGILLDAPQTRADFEDLLPAVLIESPGIETTATSPLSVRGSANVFEGVFRVAALDEKGAALADTKVTTSGTGTRGPFATTLRWSGKRRPARLIAYYLSPKDGSKVVVTRYPLARK